MSDQMNKSTLSLLTQLRWLTILTAVWTPVWADTDFLARADVQQYIDERVSSGRFDRRSLNAIFAAIHLKPTILAILDRPPTLRPWYQFRRGLFNESLLKNGLQFWKRHQRALSRAERIYGVPAEMIVAILGVETHYGKNTGSFRVVDVLATLGFFYPRRAEFFRNELTELLILAQEEQITPMALKGSYAGAMGLPQFLPSSYRKWAVDFDRAGRRDIWNSPSDAIGSIAHYFQQHGWIPGMEILVPAKVIPGPAIEVLMTDKFDLHRTVRELNTMGVIPKVAVADEAKAVLVSLEIAPGVNEYFIGLNNFFVITRYNRSTLYAKLTVDIMHELKARFHARQYSKRLR